MRFVVVVALATGCSFEHGKAVLPTDDANGSGDVAPMIDARVDAPPDARMCPAAPPTCLVFTCAGSSSCYYSCGNVTGTKNWNSAKGACSTMSLGCLVTINDQDEQNCIAANTLPSFASLVWFGWRQDPNASEPADGWGWECGTSNYVDPAWGGFEPTNTGGNEDCGQLTTGGGWNDADCGGDARYVCELP